MIWIAAFLGAALLGLLLIREAGRRQSRADVLEIMERVAARPVASPSLEPDMAFASRGFAAIALMKANSIEVDLHDAEYALAERAMRDGATLHQAMSLRWGGVQAIHAEGADYADAVGAAESAGSNDRYHHGALAYLRSALNDWPAGFADFCAQMKPG